MAGIETVGRALTRAREAKGLSADILAAQLKIPVRKLEMLERDEFDQIAGGATYVRALCRSVCKALRMDEEPLLARLPASAAAKLPERDTSLRTPFRDQRGLSPASTTNGKSASPLVYAAGALAVIALVVFLWPQLAALIPAGLVQRLTPPITASDISAAQATQAAQAAQAASAAVAAVTVSAIPAAAISVSSTVVPALPALPASAPLPSASALAPDAPPLGLSIEATETTWVEIKTPGGVVLVARNVNAGERLEQALDGKTRVIVGNASGARVFVRGAPLDLAAVNKDNVARFEVQ